jgi:hypothetical protein
LAKKKTPTISAELCAILKSDSTTTEQLASVIAEGIYAFCEQLESKSVDPEILNAVLFSVFVDRMQALGDEQGFRDLLEEALDLEWERHSLH